MVHVADIVFGILSGAVPEESGNITGAAAIIPGRAHVKKEAVTITNNCISPRYDKIVIIVVYSAAVKCALCHGIRAAVIIGPFPGVLLAIAMGIITLVHIIPQTGEPHPVYRFIDILRDHVGRCSFKLGVLTSGANPALYGLVCNRTVYMDGILCH